MVKNNHKQNYNIYINARFLTQPVTGVQRYALELIKEIDELIKLGKIDARYKFMLLAPDDIKYEINLKYISLKKVGCFRGHLWEQMELPYYSRNGLLVNLCNSAPLLKIRQIVVIHDASVYAYPQAYSFTFRTWYKILFRLLGLTSKRIITVSKYSKKEIASKCKIKSDKIIVVYEGNQHILAVKSDDSVLTIHDLSKNAFLLAVSSMNPNKNFDSVVQALSLIGEFDYDVVIAGGKNSKIYGNTDLLGQKNVKLVGYISDEQLRALYENAACFIYPSFYEGFGLPPLEAMACGCPTIVSNAASLPEVCGDASLYCDPHDIHDIASKIRLLLSDGGLQEDLRQKGYQQAKKFSWEKCAEQTMKVIESVL